MKRKEERAKRRERKGGERERGTSGSGRRIIQNTEEGGGPVL